MEKSKLFLDKLIAGIIYATIFLIPIFFLPITADIVEFNKQFLLYFLVLVGLLLWVIKGIVEKKLLIRRTPFDIPLLLIILVLFISSILSKNRMLSFWGDYTSLSNSFISFLFYAFFYFLVLNNINNLKQVGKIIGLFVASALLGLIYFVIQGFGLLSLSSTYFPRWTITSDLPTHFGYFLVLALVLAFSLVLSKTKTFWSGKNILLLLIVIVLLSGLTFMGFKSIWLIAAIAIFLLLVFSLSRIDEISVVWVSIAFGILLITILFLFLGVPKFLKMSLPTEVALSAPVSWQIAGSALSDNLKSFLLGSGPATFIYDFSAFRPELFNTNFAWSFRFKNPYSSVLDILAVSGLLGAITWVGLLLAAIGTFFVMWFVRGLKSKKKSLDKLSDLMHLSSNREAAYHHTIYAGLITGWLMLLVSMFLTTFTTVHWVMFFTLLALTYLVGSDFPEENPHTFTLSLKTLPQYTLVASFIYILLFAVIVVFVIFLGRFYTAEIYRARAIKYISFGNYTKAAAEMFKSVSLNPGYAKYYLELASAYIGMAVVESQKKAPDSQRVANLVASAVNQAREATRLAPNDAAGWDFLATMYETARSLSANANSFVISSLEKAITLEKTNPRLYLELGKAKVLNQDFVGAREAIEWAIKLKPNYVLGYVTLSQLDEMESKLNEAIEHISVAVALSSSDPTLLFNLGRLYYNRAQQDDLVRAEQLFSAAIQLNGNYSDAIWSLGVLYERKGKISDALNLYLKVQALNPDNAEVKTRINRLR